MARARPPSPWHLAINAQHLGRLFRKRTAPRPSFPQKSGIALFEVVAHFVRVWIATYSGKTSAQEMLRARGILEHFTPYVARTRTNGRTTIVP